MNKEKKKLGDMLLEAGLIDEMQLTIAISYQNEWGGKLGSIIVKKGFVAEQDMISVLEKQLGLKCISFESMKNPSDEVLKYVKSDIAKKFGFFPLKLEDKALLIAISDPTDLKTLDAISFSLSARVKPMLALESDIIKAIEVYYEGKFRPGKTHRLDKEKFAERITRFTTAELNAEPIITASEGIKEDTKSAAHKIEISQKAVIESVIDLLISKGIFTKEELINQIKSKKQS